MFAVNGYGMTSAGAPLEPISLHRRDPRPHLEPSLTGAGNPRHFRKTT
jgi:hypothetical protein